MRRLSLPTILIAVLLSAAVSLFIVHGKTAPVEAKRETAYQRVMRTGVLHCAYGLWEPGVIRDPNTGEISGIIYDAMQELGKSLNLKVVFDLEVPWDSVATSLQAGKADAHCAGIWATPSRGRVMAFSDPLFFSPVVPFARADDTRFDQDLTRINQPDITVALSDDDITTEVYRDDFATAKHWDLPAASPPEELLLALATNKADVAFNLPARLRSFEKGYPGKVKIVPTPRPLRIFPDTIAVSLDDEQLLHVLNAGIDQLIDSGAMDRIVAKYKDKYDVSFVVPVVRPYEWKQK